MPFSLSSYILGVGTVVGALAIGFGSGAFLTNTVMKENPAGPTRVQRVARSEPLPAPQTADVPVASSRENPVGPVAQAPSVDRDQAQAVQATLAKPAAAPAPAPVPAVQAEPPKPDVQSGAERAKDPAPTQPAGQARQPEQPKQAESKEAEPRKTAERKGERQKRYAERKLREITIARMKPRRFEVDEPEVVVSEPQEPHFDLFRMPGFFGRSAYRDE
jgi:hypothetical protein